MPKAFWDFPKTVTLSPAGDNEPATALPTTAESVSELVHWANKRGTCLCTDPINRASFYTPDSEQERTAFLQLDFSQLNQVSRHLTEEFIVTAEAGVTVGQLNRFLGLANQRFPLPYSESRTLHSLIADEPLSLGAGRYGTFRQRVLGLQAVTGDGQAIHYGGEVMKNVTGYDLNKLFIGSRNRYGLVASVILKLEVMPESSRAFLFHVEELHQALELVRQFERHLFQPEGLTLFRLKNSFGWQILLILSDYRERVQADSERVHDIIAHLNANLQELFLAPAAVEKWLHKVDWTHPEEPGEFIVLELAWTHKQLMDFPYRYFADPLLKSADILMPIGSGRIQFRWQALGMPDFDRLRQFQEQMENQGGMVRLLRSPCAVMPQARQFNREPQAALRRWESELKRRFDPNGVLWQAWEQPLPERQEATV